MKRARLNVILLVLAAGLGAGVWFSQEKEQKGPPLTAFTAETLNRIAIEHPGRPAIRLEKTGGEWRIVEPVQAAVDTLEVNALVALATRELKQPLEVGSVKLAEFELDPPKYTITLNDTPVAFGGVEPLNYQRYVKAGKTVGLIEDPPSAALDADYHDLVSKKLFADDAVIERIEVPGLALFRDGEGDWQLDPANPAATTDQMQKLADGWKGAQAMWNEMPGDKPPAGDAVVVTVKGGAQHRFVVVERDPQFRLYNPQAGVVHVLSKTLVEELLKLPVIPEPGAETSPPAASGAEAPEDEHGEH